MHSMWLYFSSFFHAVRLHLPIHLFHFIEMDAKSSKVTRSNGILLRVVCVFVVSREITVPSHEMGPFMTQSVYRIALTNTHIYNNWYFIAHIHSTSTRFIFNTSKCIMCIRCVHQILSFFSRISSSNPTDQYGARENNQPEHRFDAILFIPFTFMTHFYCCAIKFNIYTMWCWMEWIDTVTNKYKLGEKMVVCVMCQ